ncbi:MAG TPA: type IV pilus secretin PilQ [Gammaproteobacteria bacterium]|nr:type IV pilus secretin PilQ [Gammaproteobacteria bacterium]
MNKQTYTRGFLPLALLLATAWLAAPAFADNQLQNVQATKLAGDRVQIALTLSGAPTSSPLSFTVNQPARIALDLPDTRLALKSHKTDVQQGMVNSIVTAEAGGRSRMVINLTSLVPYTTKVEGNMVYVIVGANAGDTSVANASVSSFGPQQTGGTTVAAAVPVQTPVPAVSMPAAASPSQSVATAPVTPAATQAPSAPVEAGPGQIAAVDFRRTPDGGGEIVVTLPNPGIVGNVHDQNGNIAVDFAGARLPDELVRRMDVTDFATPVQYVDAQNLPNGSQIVVHASGQFEKMAYQTENTFAVQLKPLTPAAQAQLATKKQYVGQKISLNFQSIDIRAVLQILADASGKNIVVSDSVSGNITLRLQDVPWDQALDIILHTKGLATRTYGNVMMVGTAAEISAQETAEASAQQSLQQVVPLQSAFIQVNYAKATDLQTLIKGGGDNSLLTKRGSVSVDARTNTLLVQDTPDAITAVRALVARLDVAVRQVLIESRVVIANNDFTRDLGARLGYTGTKTINGGNGLLSTSGTILGTDAENANFIKSQNAIANANNAVGGCSPVTPGAATNCPIGSIFAVPNIASRLNVNVPAAPAAGSIAFSVLRGSSIIDLELSALQSEGQGEIVSSPRVLTADQKLAHIEQGVQIPYQQASASGATTTSFKNAVLSLDVTPQITPDERIIMDLEVHDDQVGQNVQSATGGTVPSIDTRDVKTQVLVNNGDTVVLGGIYETTQNITSSKVPLLGDLPLLGWLFRNQQTQNNKDELLIFVTPKIVDSSVATAIGQ